MLLKATRKLYTKALVVMYLTILQTAALSIDHKDEGCFAQLQYLQGSRLVFKYLDASARIPSGIGRGNLNDLGNYHQCLAISQVENDVLFEGKYCAVRVPLQLTEITRVRKPNGAELELRVHQIQREVSVLLGVNGPSGSDATNPQNSTESTSATLSATLAVCIPNVCSTSEVLDYVREYLSFPEFQYREFYCRTLNDKTLGSAEYTAIVIFGIITLLVIISTYYDVTTTKKEDSKKSSTLYRSFSLYTNTVRMVTSNKNPDGIKCLDGIRAISMFWVIIGHTYACTGIAFVQNQLYVSEWIQSFSSIWITSAPFAVDTFFTLSGLLVVYTVLHKISRHNFIKSLHLYVLHRLLRIFPLLAATILLEISLFYHLADGPYWLPVNHMAEMCKENWWVTLLHLQNYVRQDKMCVGQSWYLAVDMQLYVAAPLVLIFLFGGRKRSAAVLAMTMAISLGTCVGYSFVHSFPASVLNTYPGYMRLYYENTITRSPPFVVGMIFGYVLHLHRSKPIRIPKITACTCWMLCLGLLGLVFFGMYPVIQYDYRNELVENLYNGFARFLWAVALGWIVLACHHGYGGLVNWLLSLDMWKLPSRLSYAMYLLHIPLILVVNGTWTQTKYFSNGDTIYRYLSDVLMTMLASFALSLIVDSPFSTLQKLLMDLVVDKKSRNREQEKKTSPAELDVEKKINR